MKAKKKLDYEVKHQQEKGEENEKLDYIINFQWLYAMIREKYRFIFILCFLALGWLFTLETRSPDNLHVTNVNLELQL